MKANNVRFHYIRNLLKQNVIKIEYDLTNTILADMFAKFKEEQFIQHRNAIGVYNLKELEEIVGKFRLKHSSELEVVKVFRIGFGSHG